MALPIPTPCLDLHASLSPALSHAVLTALLGQIQSLPPVAMTPPPPPPPAPPVSLLETLLPEPLRSQVERVKSIPDALRTIITSHHDDVVPVPPLTAGPAPLTEFMRDHPVPGAQDLSLHPTDLGPLGCLPNLPVGVVGTCALDLLVAVL